MLAADKLQLQSQLRQQAVALKEKEFNLHHSNLMTVGTQAAVLAGLDITMFIEFTPVSLSAWPHHPVLHRLLHLVYYALISAAFCSNITVVSQTTALSVLGAGLALRGPDGSMMVATDALYHERRRVFTVFAAGLALTVTSVLVGVWLLLPWEAAFVCCTVASYTAYALIANYRRVAAILDFDERDTVDFRDIMDGPGRVRLRRERHRRAPLNGNHNNSSNNDGRRHNGSQSSGVANNHYNINNSDYYHKQRSHGSSYRNDAYSEESYSSENGNDDVEMQGRALRPSDYKRGPGGGGGASSSSSRRRSKIEAMQTV